jgi:ubiquinone/menaquinone biosynthesis C-methylase UbiE
MNNKQLETLTKKLACPFCKLSLKGDMRCTKCNRKWQQKDGVYLFLDKDNKIAEAELQGIGKLDKLNKVSREEFNKFLFALPELPENIRELNDGEYFTNISSGKKTFYQALEKIGTNKTVLEIGSDWGWASYNIAKRGNSVIATDINDAHLGNSKIFAAEGVDFLRVQSDMNHLPIASGSIDVIFATASVHHSPDLTETFREFSRVLVPGGRLIMLREPVSGQFLTRDNFGEKEKEVGINETAPTLKEWKKTLSGAGFKTKNSAAFLNFLEVRSLKNWLRTIKRALLSIPIIGSILAQFTVTDYNFWAVKK